jgi:hypothetical protein
MMDTGNLPSPWVSINLRRCSAGQALESWGRKISKINPKVSAADSEVINNRSIGLVIRVATIRVEIQSRLISIAAGVIVPLDQKDSPGIAIARTVPEMAHVAIPIFCGHFETGISEF